MRAVVAALPPRLGLPGLLLVGLLLSALLLVGCGAAPRASGPAATPAPSPALTTGMPPAVGVLPIGAPPPPAVPRPRLPIDTATAAADAGLRGQVSSLLSACALAGFPECARLGRHYLDATGTPLAVPVADLLTQLPTVRAQVAADLARGVAAGGPFDTGWQPVTSPAGTDWAYALGRFEVRLVGVPEGDQVRYRTFVADVYDFDVGRPFGTFRALADHGRAAEFGVTGASRTVLAPRSAPLAF